VFYRKNNSTKGRKIRAKTDLQLVDSGKSSSHARRVSRFLASKPKKLASAPMFFFHHRILRKTIENVRPVVGASDNGFTFVIEFEATRVF